MLFQTASGVWRAYELIMIHSRKRVVPLSFEPHPPNWFPNVPYPHSIRGLYQGRGQTSLITTLPKDTGAIIMRRSKQ